MVSNNHFQYSKRFFNATSRHAQLLRQGILLVLPPHGAYSVMVSTRACGAFSQGSSPCRHPTVKSIPASWWGLVCTSVVCSKYGDDVPTCIGLGIFIIIHHSNMEPQKKTLLIVEDEKELRDAIKDAFSRLGFNVFGAQNGEEGLELATTHHPDIILLDQLMPKMTGIEMLKQLRADEWGKTAKVILLTNVANTETVVEAIDQDVTQYLVKVDWTVEDVVKKVQDYLEK